MKLYGHPLSTCTRKVRFALAEKGAEAELVVIDLAAGEHRAPAHLARHPFGRIPVLDDDGFVLYESRAILKYLDERLSGPVLTPATPRERARMEQWLSVDASYVAPHVSALVRERILAPAAGRAPDRAAIDAAIGGLRDGLGAIDRALTGAWLAGPFSLADISLAPYVDALDHLGAAAALADRPRLAAWWERLTARPAWAALQRARS